MISLAMIRASAVGGIVMFWTYFTLDVFKISKEIVFPPKFECTEKKEEEVVPPKCAEEEVVPPKCAEKKEVVVCEERQKAYIDDGECNDCPHLFLDETKHKFL